MKCKFCHKKIKIEFPSDLKHFKNSGFDTLVVWEPELKGLLMLRNKIKGFSNI